MIPGFNLCLLLTPPLRHHNPQISWTHFFTCHIASSLSLDLSTQVLQSRLSKAVLGCLEMLLCNPINEWPKTSWIAQIWSRKQEISVGLVGLHTRDLDWKWMQLLGTILSRGCRNFMSWQKTGEKAELWRIGWCYWWQVSNHEAVTP